MLATILVVFAGCFVLERSVPGWRLPKVRTWPILITSFYKHPIEMVVNSLIACALVYPILGLSPQAGAIYTLCTALGEFFYHTNCRTPHFVGYVGRCGFDPEREERLGEMLCFRDVHRANSPK